MNTIEELVVEVAKQRKISMAESLRDVGFLRQYYTDNQLISFYKKVYEGGK